MTHEARALHTVALEVFSPGLQRLHFRVADRMRRMGDRRSGKRRRWAWLAFLDGGDEIHIRRVEMQRFEMEVESCLLRL